jgi:hypothetical protein
MPQDHIHRTGPVLPKQYPVKLTGGLKTNSIASGDLLALETVGGVEQLVSAVNWVWTTDEATTSDAFALKFAGVAAGRSNALKPTDTRDTSILVSQDGEYEVLVTAGAYQAGTFLKPNKAAGNALLNTCKATTDLSTAIFCVSETSLAGATRVRAYILKTAPKRMNNTNA